MEFKDLLVDDSMLMKLAVEAPDQKQIEQDFGRMAYAFLKDRAASLTPHLIGFEVVEQEPDGSKAVGLFGFQVHGKYFYVPTFFLSNQIKGMDLLYDKASDLFYPLRENWINHIVNKQTISLGDSAQQGSSQDFDIPDFNYIADPPTGGATKLSAHQVGVDLANTWNAIQASVVNSLNNDNQFKEAYASAILKMTGNPPVKSASYLTDFIEQKGGPVAARILATQLQNPKFVKAAAHFYSVEELLISDFSSSLAPKTASNVKVVTKAEVVDYSKDLNDKDRKKIVEYGFTIKDTRPKEEKSDAYTVDYIGSVKNPDHSGECDLILASGATTRVWVCDTPFGSSNIGSVLVTEYNGKGRYFTAPKSTVFIRENLEDKAYSDKEVCPLYSKAVALDDVELGSTYIFVNEKGDCSVPFTPKSITSENGVDARIKGRWSKHLTSGDHNGFGISLDVYRNNDYAAEVPYEGYVTPVDRNGSLRLSGGNVIVPTGTWKAFKLHVEDDPHNDNEQQELFAPGTYADVKESLLKIAYHDVVISSMGDGIGYNVCIDGTMVRDNMDAKTAALTITKNLGIDADEAWNILGEVKKAGYSQRNVIFSETVKKAQQVMMPPMPEQPVSYDAQLGMPINPAEEQFVEGQSQPYTPPYGGPGSTNHIGGEGARQQQQGASTHDLAQQAAAAGQQHVFDHSVVGGLAQTYDVSFAIDSYIPDLMKCLDRVGRILFLFYWKNVDFAERYGDQDLTAMEDQLRAVFKSLGDLALKLKQKTIDAEDTEFVDGGTI